jgi:type IV secretion system protein VirB8
MAEKKVKLKLKSWYSSKYQIVAMQRNIFFFISFFAICSVLIAVIFVKQIMTSKSLVPYVIEVEDKTGIPVLVEQLNKTSFTADVTLKRYFLMMFLKAAEGYDYRTFTADYKKLMLFTTPSVFRQLQKKINPRNPQSPATLLGNEGGLEVSLKSISFVTATKAIIRFRLRNVGNSSFENNRDMIADVEFQFADLKLTLEERYINPLGFQIKSYVVDRELITGYEEKR